MEAPDKLYISRLIYDSWMYRIPDPDSDTEMEYISKDALIEWLEKRFKDERKKTLVFSGKGTQALGRAEAFKEVIDKIESL